MREGVERLKRLKLLHCGDLHLDAPFASLADGDGKPEQRRQDLRRALIGIVDLAITEKVDLLLVCGDLYEHGYAGKNTFLFVCEQFRRIRDIPVLIIPGNHDPLSPDSLYSRLEWPENVRILKDRMEPFEHVQTGSRVYCYAPGGAGMRYGTVESFGAVSECVPGGADIPVDAVPSGVRAPGDAILSGANAPGTMPPKVSIPGGAVPSGKGLSDGSDLPGRVDDANINILMLHGTLDMPFSKDAYQPVSSMELDSSGYDYCALGHFHSMIPGAGRSKRIYNAGSPEPLGFDEEGEHGVFIVTIEKVNSRESHVDVSFRKLGRRCFFHLDVQAGDCTTDERTASAILSAIESAGNAEDLFSISLQGRLNRSYRPDTAYIADLLKDKAFYIKIVDRTLPDYDFEMLAEEPGLRGLFTRKMLKKADNAFDEEERKLVMQALYFGLEAIDEGSVCV